MKSWNVTDANERVRSAVSSAALWTAVVLGIVLNLLTDLPVWEDFVISLGTLLVVLVTGAITDGPDR